MRLLCGQTAIRKTHVQQASKLHCRIQWRSRRDFYSLARALVVGTAAAIANAVYHATGKMVRDLPIRIEKILA